MNATSPDGCLRHGHDLETSGQFFEALAAYDRGIELNQAQPPTSSLVIADRRTLGLLWMNRGNVLQKLPSTSVERSANADTPPAVRPAVHAYDQAISCLETLPIATEPTFRNHLGAAWLNRGHALLSTDAVAALASFRQAIAHLEKLPLDEDPFYRLNLAGAWANCAHLQLASSASLARSSAYRALTLSRFPEYHSPAFAEMSLRARRAAVMAVGELLVAADTAREPIAALASEASDIVDDGLALARTWETRGVASLRPLALRLFHFGAHLYRVHQPHFLAEFLLENAGLGAPFAGVSEFHSTATNALSQAISELSRPRHLIVGSSDSEQLLATLRSLRSAWAEIDPAASLSVPLSPLVPTFA